MELLFGLVSLAPDNGFRGLRRVLQNGAHSRSVCTRGIPVFFGKRSGDERYGCAVWCPKCYIISNSSEAGNLSSNQA